MGKAVYVVKKRSLKRLGKGELIGLFESEQHLRMALLIETNELVRNDDSGNYKLEVSIQEYTGIVRNG